MNISYTEMTFTLLSNYDWNTIDFYQKHGKQYILSSGGVGGACHMHLNFPETFDCTSGNGRIECLCTKSCDLPVHRAPMGGSLAQHFIDHCAVLFLCPCLTMFCFSCSRTRVALCSCVECVCVCVCVGDTAGCRLTGPEHHLNPLLHVQKHRAHDGCLGLGTEARHGRWKLIRNKKMSQTVSLRFLFHEVLLRFLFWKIAAAKVHPYIHMHVQTLQNFRPVFSKQTSQL